MISLPERKTVTNVENLELLKMENNIKFTSLDDISRGGIYTPEDIQEARRNLVSREKRKNYYSNY